MLEAVNGAACHGMHLGLGLQLRQCSKQHIQGPEVEGIGKTWQQKKRAKLVR